MTQGLLAWWRWASQTPRGGLNIRVWDNSSLPVKQQETFCLWRGELRRLSLLELPLERCMSCCLVPDTMFYHLLLLVQMDFHLQRYIFPKSKRYYLCIRTKTSSTLPYCAFRTISLRMPLEIDSLYISSNIWVHFFQALPRACNLNNMSLRYNKMLQRNATKQDCPNYGHEQRETTWKVWIKLNTYFAVGVSLFCCAFCFTGWITQSKYNWSSVDWCHFSDECFIESSSCSRCPWKNNNIRNILMWACNVPKLPQIICTVV